VNESSKRSGQCWRGTREVGTPLDRLVRSGAQYLLQKVLEKGRADQSGPTLPKGGRLLAVGLRHLGQSVGELARCADDTGDTAGSGPASSTTDRTTRKGIGSSLKKSSKGRLTPPNLQENWDLTTLSVDLPTDKSCGRREAHPNSRTKTWRSHILWLDTGVEV